MRAAAKGVRAAIRVGCAGWALPAGARDRFPAGGTSLERYASTLPAAEINSSFHRPHRPATYARWAASVPAAFRFTVKVPKAITHTSRLAGADRLLADFLAEAASLGPRLGCLLVQLPPGLVFDGDIASAFFASVRERYDGAVALEPRHLSWFTSAAEALLVESRISRVAADPARVPEAAAPAGWTGTVYYRLHGSPRTYFSSYDAAFLQRLAAKLRAHASAGSVAYCIFDNTALGAATSNALDLSAMVTAAGG